VVQDPATAFDPAMPRAALAAVDVDHCLAPGEMGQLLARLVRDVNGPRLADAAPPPEQLLQEHAVFEGRDPLANLQALGEPVPLTCPTCGGGLWEMKHPQRPLRFRCHTGHAYTAASLAAAQDTETDHALQAGLRGLQEREMLLRRLAAVAESLGDANQAAVGRQRADEVREQVSALRKLIEKDMGRA
jgi:two-component system, chemotaxis family, protein-glutamate methylesterase/glutaminase